jgi:hypothetical protein
MIQFDKYGLVVQTNGDGGDSPARTGLYYFLLALLNEETIKSGLDFFTALLHMQKGFGAFIRNPVNYNNPKDMSRDQLNPLIIAMGAYRGHSHLLWELLWKRIKAFGFYPNGDYSSPEHWCMLFRALRLWWLYPIFFLGDIFTLINSIVRCILGTDPNNVGDDINHCMSLLQQLKYPTPISWAARKLYSKLRPGGVQRAWDWYFRPETGANPFNEMARPVIKEWLS